VVAVVAELVEDDAAVVDEVAAVLVVVVDSLPPELSSSQPAPARTTARTAIRRMSDLITPILARPGTLRAACGFGKDDGPSLPNSLEMDNRRPSHNAVNARSARGLAAIVRRARGWTCDVRAVALDDQTGKLHVPLLAKLHRSSSDRVAAGELVVNRVEEFVVEGAARRRWFELDGLAYEPVTRRVSIRSDGRSQLALTVEELDVTLRIRPQTRLHS
jgi:hypothetical protein